MSIATQVLKWFGLPRRQQRAYEGEQYTLLLGGGPTYAGPSVTEDNAMRSGVVYACIRIISESIASLPLILYRQSGRAKERATNHALYTILHDLPNPEQTALEWRELMLAHCLLRGNGYSEKEFDSFGRVVALWPLNPAKMEDVRRGDDGQLTYFYRTPDNVLRAIPAYRIHHLRGLGNGIVGYSPVMWAGRQAIGLALGAEEFGARFYSNGTNLGTVLKVPGKLSPAAYARLQQSFENSSQGLSNAHRMKILEEGMDVAKVGIPPDEAQFLETRKFQVTEIARIFRVPPHMLADLERATFSNIEHQSLEFVMHTLRPWLVRHEQAIYRDLLTLQERKTLFAKYVVEGLLRGDVASRYAAYASAISAGHMTRNEARELEDRNPLEGLDEPLLPLNMMEANASMPAATPATSTTGARNERRAEEVGNARRELMQRHVRLFAEAMGRVVKREVADIRKAAKSRLGKRDVASFEAWLASFYEQLRAWFPDYFAALMETYAETVMASVANELGGEPAPLDDELRAWIAGYLANLTEVYAVGGEKQLRALLAEAEDDQAAQTAIEERLDGWEATKAGKEGFDQAFEAGNALAVYGYAAAGVSFLVWQAQGKSCPLCQRMNGRRIRIGGYFLQEGDTVEAEGVDPLPIIRKIRHPGLHRGCDCVVRAG